MRPTYLLVGLPGTIKPAIADIQPEGTTGKVVRMTRINVPQEARGQGYGTRLLAQVLNDADEQGVVVMLEPLATPVRLQGRWLGLPQPKLHAWYQRHGFVWYTPAGRQAGPAGRDSVLAQWFMVRPPAGQPAPADLAALAGLAGFTGNYYQRSPAGSHG